MQLPDNTYFNSSLVRLEVYTESEADTMITDFNSSLVRLEELLTRDSLHLHFYFNSSLVRLEGVAFGIKIYSFTVIAKLFAHLIRENSRRSPILL
jgi:hypothetical protein